MLKSVRLKNFKLFKEAEIPLERLTVFVGPNGSGKTTVLEAIYCVTQITHAKGKRPSELFVGRLLPSQVKTRNAIEATTFGCVAGKGEESDFLEFDLLELVTRDGIRHWDFAGRGKQGKCISSTLDEPLDGSSQIVEFSTPDRLILSFSERGQLLRLDASRIAEPSERGSVHEISETGEGVATIVARMALSQPENFQHFKTAVRAIIPNFRQVRVDERKLLSTENLVYKDGEKIVSQPVGRELDAYTLILDMSNGVDLPGNCGSEGTLLTIGILAVLMGPSQPKLLLLDDIDRGLHPRAMEQFVKILRELLAKDPELQIIATSHSPFLLNQLDYNEVRITSLDDEGLAHAALLSDHPDFERWKDVMSPGEFWSTVGESWAAGNGKPAHG